MAQQITCGTHWLTFTAGDRVDRVLALVGGGFSELERRGGFGHPARYVHESGASVYVGSPREEQPVVVNVPGETCEAWAGHFRGVAEEVGGTVTRIDLAVDVDPAYRARRRLVEMRRAWLRGKVQTAMDSRSHEWMQNEEGATAYFGGRQSEARLRCYDRRGPLRLEWQWRPQKELGRHVPQMVRSWGEPAMWRSLSQRAVWPMAWYHELLDGETAEWGKVKDCETDLVEAVASLRKQFGTSFWAFLVMGMRLEDLAVEPESPRGEVVRKLLRFAKQGRGMGYDGERLESEIRCKLESRRVRT